MLFEYKMSSLSSLSGGSFMTFMSEHNHSYITVSNLQHVKL